MKEFFKYTLATVVGILFLGLFSLLMSLLSMGIMMASGDEETKVKDGSVLRLSLSGILSERASEDEFARCRYAGAEGIVVGLGASERVECPARR